MADFSCFISGRAILRIAVSTDHMAYRCEFSLSEVWILLTKRLYQFLITFRSSFWRDTGVVSWYRLLEFPIHSTTFIVIYFTSLQLMQCRLNVQEPNISWKLSVLIYFVRFSMFLSSFARKVRTTGNAGQIEKINLVLNSQDIFLFFIIIFLNFIVEKNFLLKYWFTSFLENDQLNWKKTARIHDGCLQLS